MRIAIFSEVYWPMVSGVAVTLDRLAQALGRRGHTVRVYTGTYPLPPGVGDRSEVCRLPSVPLFLYPDVQWAFPAPGQVRHDLAAFKADIAHVATEWTVGRVGARAARGLGVPIIASAHTDYDRYAGMYDLEWMMPLGWCYLRWFYNQASRVLAPSTVYETHLRRRGVVRTGLWSRGVDAEAFSPSHRSAEFRASLGIGPDDVVVTYVGRLAREKNLELLLDCWSAVRQHRPRLHLLLVGGGPSLPTVRARELPGVHCTGPLTGQALATAFASGDIFAHPSVTETFGNALLEAMASGLACVVAAAGGPLDFAKEGENALLVAPGDRAALTTALARLADDVTFRHRLGEGARATALGRGWDAIYDGLIEEYRATIKASRR